MLAIVFSVTGGTFAWFTDSETSENNIIRSGELNVEMQWAEGKMDPAAASTAWKDAADANVALFDYDLWEPGYTQVRHVKISNIGTLALKYDLKIIPTGDVSKLAKVIDVLYLDENSAKAVTSRADLDSAANLGTLADFIALNEDNGENTAKGRLKAGEQHTVTIALKMQETAGNEYQGLSIGSDFKLVLYATQDTVETDSFDNQYDAGAAHPDLPSKVYTVAELEKKYAFSYFPSLSEAVGAINDGNGMSGSNTKDENTIAGVYTNEAGELSVVLMKDTTMDKRIAPAVDMNLNLGGHTLSANEAICINVMGGNLVVDGRLEGSAIVQTGTASGAGCIQVPAGGTAESVTILGGTYKALNQNGGLACALNLKNKTCVTTIVDCDITASTTNETNSKYVADGIVNDGTVIIKNSNIRAYSDYNSSGSVFTALSYGIWNTGSLTISDSYVFGVHSGIASTGSLDINGGTLEGYGNGGLYVSGDDKTAYVRNATLKDTAAMPEGYTSTAPHNGSAMVVDGGDGKNLKVYMDHCELYGTHYAGVLRGTSGTPSNNLYISNSKIDTDTTFRIDNSSHRLYIGSGNQFDAAHVSMQPGIGTEVIVETNEVYN